MYSFQHCDQHPPDPFLGTLYQSCMGFCSSFGFSTLRSLCRPGAVDSCSDPTLGVSWWSVREVVAALSYKPHLREAFPKVSSSLSREWATSADSEASKFSGACTPMTLAQVSESCAVLIRVPTLVQTTCLGWQLRFLCDLAPGGQLRANDAVTSALALSWCADPVTGRPQPGFSWEALMVFIRGLPALQSCPFYPHTAPTSELLHEAVHSIHMDPGPQETHRWEPW